MHSHFSGNMPQNHMPVFKFDLEGSIRQVLGYLSLHFNDVFLGHELTRPRSLEIRFFEQALILMGHQIRLHLSNEIHCDNHDNE